jgi:hypothetical protein
MGPGLNSNYFDVSSQGEFLGGEFSYLMGEESASALLIEASTESGVGLFDLVNYTNGQFNYSETFYGQATFAQVAPVPEPWSIAMLGSGLVALAACWMARGDMRRRFEFGGVRGTDGMH